MAIKPKRVILSGRNRRKVRIHKRLEGIDRPRLCVYRSTKHISAQVIENETGKILASASTLEKAVCDRIGSMKVAVAKSEDGAERKVSRSTKSVAGAMAVGSLLAERAIANQVKRVVFDRNGFLYHGRIQALADAAREAGLDF